LQEVATPKYLVRYNSEFTILTREFEQKEAAIWFVNIMKGWGYDARIFVEIKGER
jgi:hypothetical protein